MHIDTKVARLEAAPGDRYRPTSTPIYQTATFSQESATEFGSYDYSRSGNPTRTVLEAKLASLEGGRHGFAFASGMAALSALMRSAVFPENGHRAPDTWLLVGGDMYGGTTRLIEKLVAPLGVRVCSVDTTDLGAVERALAHQVSLCPNSEGAGFVLLESPSNPLLGVTDIAAVAARTHAAHAKLFVDNTALSPYLQNPLQLGADAVVHSGTKHLGGHGDVTAGALVTSDESIERSVAFLRNAEGSALAPFDSWLLLRGIKTLAVRMAAASRSAMEVARYLESKLGSESVFFPGLESHPGHLLQKAQSRGFGQLMSFRAGTQERAKAICQGTRLFSIAVSFGSTSSTLSMPHSMSHASIPKTAIQSGRASAPPRDLVRLSIGLEHPGDLIADLECAMGEA